MDIKKIFLGLMASLFIIFGSFGSVVADMNTSVPVNGTLYSQSNGTTPTNPKVEPTINEQRPVVKPDSTNDRFGKFGDEGSGLMVIGGLMLILTAIGLIIRRQL